jgi:hypothetical protein
MTEAESVIEQGYLAYNARDAEGFVALYADNAELYRPLETPWLVGAEQLRSFFVPHFRSEPNAKALLIKRIVHGDYVVDHETITGRSSGADLTSVWIYRVQNGKIVRGWCLV